MLRLSAYYYSFEPTEAPSIDRILSAVACAGKAFHHTEQWSETCEAYMSETKGNSCIEWIQNAAKEAAEERAALLAALEEQVERWCQMANSGDAGFWDPEKEPEIIEARALIAKARGRG